MDAQEFAAHVVDLMQQIGPVYSKRMFGGSGVFLEGLMFGLIADNVLYFKADEQTRDEFVSQGLQPFTYYKQGKAMHLSYYQAPEEAMEDLDTMSRWANRAYQVALRAAADKKPAKKSATRPKKQPARRPR